jgi:GTPase SAR1 family protein
LLVAGLPGCGKTTYLKQLCRNGWSVFDDFKAAAIDNSSAFRKSRRFAVADIDFCWARSREEAENDLRTSLPGIEIEWCFFAHDEGTCEKNIRRRNRTSLKADLAALRTYSHAYSIPAGAAVRPVFVAE